ncbi:MAG TPA: DUF1841 family protein [Myxococcaceae bacterium]|nr:DUF1841 family protein [Myxococcaceae bacterium]
MDYDPSRDPDPLVWQRTPDADRVAAVERAHQPHPRRHPPIANLRLHAAVHVTVESQLASDSPPEVRRTLSRLMRAGLSRHEALHAVGEVAAEALARVVQQRQPFDAEAYARALAAVDPTTLPRGADNDEG